MAAPIFEFESVRQEFQLEIQACLEKSSDEAVKELEEKYAASPGSEYEKKLAVDQAFRDVLKQRILIDAEPLNYTDIILVANATVTKDVSSASSPFILLADIFDSLTLEKCEEMFEFVEQNVDTWKSEVFYSAGKNYLLRMCNDLLRRLSKSQHTIFCGRIQLFLARLFPLDERSGLNLMSHFNLDNVTTFISTQEDYSRSRKQSCEEKERYETQSMDIEEGETDDSGAPPIDYNLYRRFWSLQDFFRKPTQCYEKVPWKTFITHTKAVLETFDSYKLDDTKTQRQKLEQLSQQGQHHTYFAKYLTSEKLLDLQLSDSNFRRYVLVQFLSLFQYLNASVKFKNSSQVLSDDQATWTKTTTEQVYKLLRETPPDGDKFATSIEHILNREENWSAWKNDACPSFVRNKVESGTDSKLKASRAKKRSIGDDLKINGGKIIKMGNQELTRLWNLNTDHMAACSSTEREFVPDVATFLEDAIDQADPEQMVDEEYKLINNPTWGWKALRLLSRKSQYFHQQPKDQPKSQISLYLNDMISKEANDMKESQSPSGDFHKESLENDQEQNPAERENQDLNEPDTTKTVKKLSAPSTPIKGKATKDKVTKHHISVVAPELGDDWKKLAEHLKFTEDDVEDCESDAEGLRAQATKMLTMWMENEGENATKVALSEAFNKAGLSRLSSSLLGVKKEQT